MSNFHTAADIARTNYIIGEAKNKRACLKYLEASAITNKEVILKSYKKEIHMQMYPCLIMFGLMIVGIFLLFFGEDKGQVGPYAGIGLILFMISFIVFIIWLTITAILFRKEPYTEYYKWFISANPKHLERVLEEETIFEDGYPKNSEGRVIG